MRSPNGHNGNGHNNNRRNNNGGNNRGPRPNNGNNNMGGGNNGNRRPSPQNLRNQVFDSHGPGGERVRGNAFQVHEKYLSLARDAEERIDQENYYQHAEHYYRIVEAIQELEAEQRSRFTVVENADPFAAGNNDGFGDQPDVSNGEQRPQNEQRQHNNGRRNESADQGDQQDDNRGNRQDSQRDNRADNRGNRYSDDGNNGGEQRSQQRQPRHNQQGDRPQNERPQGDRPQNERPQGDRPQRTPRGPITQSDVMNEVAAEREQREPIAPVTGNSEPMFSLADQAPSQASSSDDSASIDSTTDVPDGDTPTRARRSTRRPPVTA